LVLAEPPPSAVVLELQEYAVVFRARAYVRSPDYWKALYALQKDVKAALDRANVLPAVNRQAPVSRSEPAVAGNRRPEPARDSAANSSQRSAPG
jgi:small-conductance mechanosensitive channel